MDLVQKKFVPATILLFFISFWTVYSQELTGPTPDRPCPGEVVTFTCVTRGSQIIAWRSDDYIGTTQLEFGAVNNVGAMDGNRDKTAIATLTGNDLVGGVRVLTSELNISASSDFRTSSVSCLDIGSGGMNNTLLQVLAAPNMPRDMVYDRRNDSTGKCSVHLSWIIPDNSIIGDMLDYKIYINGEYAVNESSDAQLTITAYSVCNCMSHTVSIRAVNRCGHVGQSTPVITLESNPKYLPTVMCTDRGPTAESYSPSASSPPLKGSNSGTGFIAAVAVLLVLLVSTVVIAIVLSCVICQKPKKNDNNKPQDLMPVNMSDVDKERKSSDEANNHN